MKKLLFLLLLAAPTFGDIDVTPGTGKTVATDSVASKEYQKIKIIDGTAGNTTAAIVDTSGNLQVAVTTLTIISPSGTAKSVGYQATGSSVPVNVLNTINAAQSGTYTVQPGNTQNTTPWLVDPDSGTVQITDKTNKLTFLTGSPSQAGTEPSVPIKAVGVSTVAVTGTVAATQSGTWNVGTVTTITNAVNSAQSGTWTVQPGNTANTSPWLVDPDSGTVQITDKTNKLTLMTGSPPQDASTAAVPIKAVGVSTVSVTGTATIAGTVQPGNTPNTTPWLVTNVSSGIVHTALPTAASDSAGMAIMVDKFGRVVDTLDCPRDLVGTSTVTLTATTSEVVFISSGASGVFNDITSLMVLNTSASAARVTFRSGGGQVNGTITFELYVPAGDMRGLTSSHPWPQSTSAANWSIQSSASLTDIRAYSTYCKSK